MSYRVNRERNSARMLKTILPSLPRAITILETAFTELQWNRRVL